MHEFDCGLQAGGRVHGTGIRLENGYIGDGGAAGYRLGASRLPPTALRRPGTCAAVKASDVLIAVDNWVGELE